MRKPAPQDGPRVLFFSGGTALRGCSRELVSRTHNSIHLITPFDSGGSSAELRKAFRMPAVGDVRNRMLSLADRTAHGQPEIFSLLAHRFGADEPRTSLRARLEEMVAGRDPLVAAVPEPKGEVIRSRLGVFAQRMPGKFDLRGASIGNLVLTGGYLSKGRRLDPVCELCSELAKVRGVVRPMTEKSLHLVAELADGQTLVGQHLLTGKQVARIEAPVERIYLSRRKRNPEPLSPPLRDPVRDLIAQADLICYPIGSFYSSVVVNLLLAGVGACVAENPAPKVYVPNTGDDPEQLGLDLAGQVGVLLRALGRDENREFEPRELLGAVLIDPATARRAGRALGAIQELGIQIIEEELISPASEPLLDPARLAEVLVSLSLGG